MSYKEDLKINKYELETLWEDHQDRFMKWAELHAEAIKERDSLKQEFEIKKIDAKNNLDRVRARLDINLKLNYKEYGFDTKPSDKVTESWIMTRAEYSKAQNIYNAVIAEYSNKLIEMDYKVNMLKSTKEAFEHRKAAMDNLTRLMIGGYFSGKLPKELRDDVEKIREQEIDKRRKEHYSKKGIRHV